MTSRDNILFSIHHDPRACLPNHVHMFCQLEIVISFFVGFYDEDGIYVDNLGKVVRTYLGSFWLFWFDAITSIPFSLIDFRVAQVTVTD
jgi:hypothetical protein